MFVESALHMGLGLFFASSGAHKLFNRDRRKVFIATLAEDLPRVRLGFAARLFATYLPLAELLAGLVALATIPLHLAGVGILADGAMAAMVGILAGAVACEGRARVASYKPLDLADAASDWLYLPEVGLMALALVALVI